MQHSHIKAKNCEALSFVLRLLMDQRHSASKWDQFVTWNRDLVLRGDAYDIFPGSESRAYTPSWFQSWALIFLMYPPEATVRKVGEKLVLSSLYINRHIFMDVSLQGSISCLSLYCLPLLWDWIDSLNQISLFFLFSVPQNELNESISNILVLWLLFFFLITAFPLKFLSFPDRQM